MSIREFFIAIWNVVYHFWDVTMYDVQAVIYTHFPRFLIFDGHTWWHSILLFIFWFGIYLAIAVGLCYVLMQPWIVMSSHAYYEKDCNTMSPLLHGILFVFLLISLIMDIQILTFLIIFYIVCFIYFVFKGKLWAFVFPFYVLYEWIFYAMAFSIFLPAFILLTFVIGAGSAASTAGDSDKYYKCSFCGRGVKKGATCKCGRTM